MTALRLPLQSNRSSLASVGGPRGLDGRLAHFLISLVPADTAFARCACTLVRRSGEGMLIFPRARPFEE
eukprot:3342908-Pyramimonas_sp.AAC.1